MWPLRSTGPLWGCSAHVSAPTVPSTCPPHSPAGSGVQTQLALSDGIIKAGGIAWALSYIRPLWTSLRPGTVATACPVGEPHPGQAIVGLTPRLAACGSGCIGLICMPRSWTKDSHAGELSQYWFWELEEKCQNVKFYWLPPTVICFCGQRPSGPLV